jgi:hypothetical protein
MNLRMTLFALLSAAVLACAGPAWGQAAESSGSTTRPTVNTLSPDQVRKLIADLDDADNRVRREADLRLNGLGEEALGPVEEALKKERISPEQRLRLEAAVKVLRPRTRLLRRYREQSEWERQTLHDAYQKFGDTNPDWDANAHQAIDLFLDLSTYPLRGPAEPRKKAMEVFQQAVAKGCKDPLVLSFYHGTVGEKFGMHEGPIPKPFYQVAVMDPVERKYPTFVRFYLLTLYLRYDAATPQTDRPIFAAFREFAAKPDDMPKGEFESLAWRYYVTLQKPRLGGYRDKSVQAFVKLVEDLAPDRPIALTLRGAYHFDMAVRYSQAPTFFKSEEAYEQTHADELSKAAAALEAAAAADPNEPGPPTMMISVEWQRKADGAVVQKWLERAIEANPDNYEACKRAMHYLVPQYPDDAYGEMFRFSRWCVATKNWRSGIPFLLIDAHEIASNRSGDRTKYFEQREVWDDVRQVFEGALVNRPDNQYARSHYVKYAALSGQWKVANRELQRMNDQPDLSVFGSKASYQYLKKKAARLGAAEKP